MPVFTFTLHGRERRVIKAAGGEAEAYRTFLATQPQRTNVREEVTDAEARELATVLPDLIDALKAKGVLEDSDLPAAVRDRLSRNRPRGR